MKNVLEPLVGVLHFSILGNSIQSYFLAFFAFFSLLLLARLVVKRLGRYFARRGGAPLLLQFKVNWLIAVVAIYAAKTFLDFSPKVDKVISGVLLTFFVYIVIHALKLLGGSLIDRILVKEGAEYREPATTTKFFLSVLLWTIGLFFILDNLGFDITTAVAGLGIGGLSLALAGQTFLADAFGSISILLDKPFKVGDFIIVGDSGDNMGAVERIGLKTTRIRSPHGQLLVVPNTSLTTSRIHNYKDMKERRVVAHVGVVYETPSHLLKKIPGFIREIICGQKGVRFDRVHFREFGESGLVFEIVYFVVNPDYNFYMDSQQAINYAIKDTFEAHGIEFAHSMLSLNG